MILLLVLFTCVPGAAQTRNAAPMPQVQIIGEGVVWRISENKDQHGRLLPPWNEVKITNVFGFKKRPVIGNKVTIVPLDAAVAPLDLKIIEIKERKECGSQWWEVELEPVKEKKFFEIAPGPNRAQEFPFDVSVIYPSVKSANQLNRDMLKQNMLPKGIILDTVKAAIDLTNDEIPDVVIIKYCCGNPKKAAEGCDYTCGKTYKKIGNVWKLIDSSAPC